MRKGLYSLLAALPVFLAACDSGGEKQQAVGEIAPFVGSWKLVDGKGLAAGNEGTVYKLDKTGKLVMGGVTECTIAYAASQITQQCGKDWKKVWKVKVVDKDTLVWEDTDTGNAQSFTLKRE